jgi:murein DD-endopeptidase MepM/ murein hydrolase activator NlpD
MAAPHNVPGELARVPQRKEGDYSVRLFLLMLFLIPVHLVSAGGASYADDHLRVDYFPKRVRQGDVCLIRASGGTSFRSIYGEFKGGRFPVAPGEQRLTYEGLIGIDMRTRPATYEIKVIATDEEGRVHSKDLTLKVDKIDFGTEKLSLPSHMVDLDAKTLERVNKEAEKLQSLFRAFRNERLWRGAFVRPVEGELSASFGLNRIINGKQRSPHTGVDLRAEEGTPVLACNNGSVVLADDLFFAGKTVILDHGWGLYSMYCHFSEALVKEGDRVNTGAMLGRAGSTGRSTKPHLHWAIRINGDRVDPLSLLKIGNN